MGITVGELYDKFKRIQELEDKFKKHEENPEDYEYIISPNDGFELRRLRDQTLETVEYNED